MAETEIGRVDEYYAKIGVVGIALSGELQVGNTIYIKGHTTDLEQSVDSMQIEHDSVERAGPGVSVGLKAQDRCRRGDHVYKVTG